MNNKRKYVRLGTVFPVEFSTIRLPDGLLDFDWQTGTTKDVSEEGMCLETKELSRSVIEHMIKEHVQLEVRIKLPKPVRAVASVAWHEQKDNLFLVGLKFQSIKKEDVRRILKHAHWFRKLSDLAWILAVAIISYSIFIQFFTLML